LYLEFIKPRLASINRLNSIHLKKLFNKFVDKKNKITKRFNSVLASSVLNATAGVRVCQLQFWHWIRRPDGQKKRNCHCQGNVIRERWTRPRTERATEDRHEQSLISCQGNCKTKILGKMKIWTFPFLSLSTTNFRMAALLQSVPM